MKYTAFATIFIGFVILGYAGIQYRIEGPSDPIMRPYALPMILPFVFGVLLILLGTGLWFFGGRGYVRTWPRSNRINPSRAI